MRHFKKGLYMMTGLAYANHLYERLRKKGIFVMAAKVVGADDLAKAIAGVVTFLAILLLWPFVLVLDITTDWDVVTTEKRESKTVDFVNESTQRSKNKKVTKK